jgi:uncharacterized membrane protein YfcA
VLAAPGLVRAFAGATLLVNLDPVTRGLLVSLVFTLWVLWTAWAVKIEQQPAPTRAGAGARAEARCAPWVDPVV